MPQISARTSADEQIPVICDNDGALYSAADALMLAYNHTLSGWSPVALDDMTTSLVVISFEHHEIHEGNTFTADYFPGDVSAGASAIIVLETANTSSWCHVLYEAESENETTLYMLEDVSYASSGTRIIPRNKNRNSSTSSPTWIHYEPSSLSLSGATLIRVRHWGSGKAIGGYDRGLHEVVLKKNTKYAFILVNNSVSSSWIEFILHWYEASVT